MKDHAWAKEAGGLSGKPVFEKSNKVLAVFANAFSGKIPIIGVGGISCKADAEEKLRLGADLVQIYTSFVYMGPALVRELVESRTPSQHLRP